MARDVEAHARACLRAGDTTAAAVAVIEGYGAAVLDYLHAICRGPADAEDVFSLWCERLLLKLPTFEGRSALRTWAYRVARNLAATHTLRAARRREDPLSEIPEIADAIRSTTADYMRTTVKSRLEALRAELDEEDRSLLLLRVEHRLTWNEIARILVADDESDERTVAARLRKRFERIKTRLREELGSPG